MQTQHVRHDPSARPATMRDVAKLAGVSQQTVSRTLNAPETVKGDTRERVERAIEQLRYRRNLSARALVTSQSHMIGLLMPRGAYFGPSSMANAIQSTARKNGFACVTAHTDDATIDTDAMGYFLTLGVDGIIVIAPTLSAAQLVLPYSSSVPVAVITAKDSLAMYAGDGVTIVGIDQEAGSREAMKHMIEHGHTNIGMISGPLNWFDAESRRRGWLAELDKANLPSENLFTGGWQAGEGYRAAMAALTQPDRPTALICANDDAAIGAYHAAKELNLQIPRDLAIIGFDDIPNSAYFTPPLTTVSQPFERAGEEAISVILRDLGMPDPGFDKSEPLMSKLVIRQSCGCK